MDVYGQLGVRRIINAKGPSTRVSGNIMDARVAEAMVAASRECVDMTALQARAAEVIAEVTGAESGIVTSGAAAGLLLGTAACLTGLDPSRMNRLPDTAGMADEVVMARSQRNQYDHAIRATGARLVEVGLPDRLAGPGVRDAEPWEYAAAVTDRTAAIFYLAHRASRPALEDVARVARDAGVPLIGMGGIQYWQDAVEFLLAGATGLAVGTALFVNPAAPVTIMEGLQDYLKQQGCQSINEIIGALELPGDPPRTPYP